ncbi:hypothetical protein Tco_0927338 [Tanacetum coccineum]
MRTSKYGESNASASDDPTLRAGNPVKEILLILDLSNHRYGYIKNHEKTVKNGQTRTRERKSVQKPEAFYEKVKKSKQWSTSVKESQLWVNKSQH